MHRLARSLTNQSCGPLLIWNGPLQIWNGTLFSKMAPWCGQVRGHSLFDKKFFPIPVLWVKLKKINIVYHFPQYESLRIVLCHYDLCWFLAVYGFDKLTWTWGGKTMLFRGRSWKSPLEHQRRCHRLKNNMNRKDHDLLSSTGSLIALGYATTNFFSS